MAGEVIDEAYVAVKAKIDPTFSADVNNAVQASMRNVNSTVQRSLEPVQKTVKSSIEDPIKKSVTNAEASAKKSFEGMEKSAQKSGGVINSAFKGAFAGVAAAFGGAAIIGGLKESISTAAELQDVTAANSVVFGKSSKDIEAFANTATKSYGLSKLAAQQAAGQFGTFGKSAGLTGRDLSGFSTELTGLAADLASFKGTSTEEAIQAVGGALRGETEPIRKYGVLLDDASLRAEAMRQGLVKTTKEALTPQQKVLAAHALILAKTKDAQGDYAKTSDSAANSIKTFQANIENLKSGFGTALLPAVQAVAGGLNSTLIPALSKAGGAIKTALSSDAVKGIVENLKSIFTDLAPVFELVGKVIIGVVVVAFKALVPILGVVTKVLATVIGFVREHIEFFKIFGITLAVILSPILALVAALGLFIAAMKAFSIIKTVIAGIKALYLVAAANPFALVVIAIAALVAGLIYAYKHSETFRAAIDKVGAVLRDVFTAAVDKVVSAFGFLKSHFDIIKTAMLVLLGPIGWIILAFQNWDKIKEILAGIGQSIADFAAKVGQWLLGALESVGKFVLGAIVFFATLPVRVGAAVIGLVAKLAGVFKDAFVAAGQAITNGITRVVGFFADIPSKLAALGTSLFNAGKNLMTRLLDGLQSVGGFVGDIAAGLGRALTGVINRVVINPINSGIRAVWAKLPDVLGDAPQIRQLARGAVVKAKRGGVLAVLAEGGSDEAVVPLGRKYARDAARVIEQSGLLDRGDIAGYLSRRTPAESSLGSTGEIAPVSYQQYPPMSPEESTTNVTINNIFNGPTSGAERRADTDWSLRYGARFGALDRVGN